MLPAETLCFKCKSYLNGFGPGLLDFKQTTIESKTTNFCENVMCSDFNIKSKKRESKCSFKTFEINICNSCLFNCLCLNLFESFGLKKDFSLRFMKNVVVMSKLTKVLVIEAKKNSILENYALLQRAAEAFVHFNGSKNSIYISICSFRMLVRRCGLCDFFNLSSVENVFLEVAKDWKAWKSKVKMDEFLKSKTSSSKFGISYVPFQGFVQVLYKVAELQFTGNNLREKIENLIKQIVKIMHKEKKDLSIIHKLKSSQRIKNKKKILDKKKSLLLPKKENVVLKKYFLQSLKSCEKDKDESIAKFSERSYKNWLNICLYDNF